MNTNVAKFIGHEQAKGDNMMSETKTREILEALSDAGLCVCEARLIGTSHPGLCEDFNYIIGRLEESGALEP